MLAIISKPIVDKLREIFEIPDDIEIIFLRHFMILCNPPLGMIITFIDQLFDSIRLSFLPLVREFLCSVRDPSE